jgi:hypothetical protein
MVPRANSDVKDLDPLHRHAWCSAVYVMRSSSNLSLPPRFSVRQVARNRKTAIIRLIDFTLGENRDV